MRIEIELSGDDIAWLGGYVKGRNLAIESGSASKTNIDKILEQIANEIIRQTSMKSTEDY